MFPLHYVAEMLRTASEDQEANNKVQNKHYENECLVVTLLPYATILLYV